VADIELRSQSHDHRRALIWLDGPGGSKIPAAGLPSVSERVPHGGEDGAGYTIFRIDGAAGTWRCEMIARQRAGDGTIREAGRQML
jgi:hypothetical protein